MKRISRVCILSVLLLFCMVTVVTAQETVKQSTDFMRSNGRIYVVIAVMLTILAGLILYMVRLDRKLSRLEKGN